MAQTQKGKAKRQREPKGECRCSYDPDFGRFLPHKGKCPVHKESFTRTIF